MATSPPSANAGKRRLSISELLVLIAAVGGLIFAALAWWDGHQNVRIEVSKTRHDVRTIDVTLEQPHPSSPSDRYLSIIYQNIGDVPMALQKTSVTFSTLYLQPSESEKACYADLAGKKFETPDVHPRQLDRMDPSGALVLVKWPLSCASVTPNMILEIDYTGKDSSNYDFTSSDGFRLGSKAREYRSR